MKKTIYEAPIVEQINVRFEAGILTVSNGNVRASGQGFIMQSEEDF